MAQTTLYKQWGKDRFLSIGHWIEANKLIVDIGTVANGSLRTNTKTFVDILQLASYLDVVRVGHGVVTFPASSSDPPETFWYYGGGVVEGKPVSRILKVCYWNADKNPDPTAFLWKVGHFEATKSPQGAFIPQFAKPISQDSIKVSRVQQAEISYRLNLLLAAYAVNNPGWPATEDDMGQQDQG